VYFFSLKHKDGGRLRLEDHENNHFTIEMQGQETNQRGNVVCDLAGIAEGVEGDAIIAQPMEPRLFVLKGYWNIPTDRIFCTEISLRIICTGISLLAESFGLKYPYWPNVLC
jgi:hypothetical protein